MNERTALRWGYVGIAGGILAILGDILSVFNLHPGEGYVATSISVENLAALMHTKAPAALLAGHYLALFAVPLEGAGVLAYSYLSFRRRDSISAQLFAGFGALLVVWGTAYHAIYGLVSEAVRSGEPQLIERVSKYYDPLGIALSIAILIFVGFYALLILLERTAFPKWFVVISPLGVFIVIFLTVLILPREALAVKSFLVVTAMNTPLLLWVILSMVLRRGIEK